MAGLYRSCHFALLAAGLLLLGAAAPTFGYAQGRIELDLVFEEGFPITGQHEWMQALSAVGIENVRIRQATGGEQPELVAAGTERSPVYKVKGILSRNSQLYVPGGRFTSRDRAGISAWKERLAKGGEAGLTPKPRAAFGLSSDQLVAIHERLAAVYPHSTKGATPKEVVRGAARLLPNGVTIDPTVIKVFDDEWTVPEEMQGLSAGTVLAATLRPLGLVLVPQAKGEDDVRLVITDVRSSPESWPVGWPPEKKDRDLAPKLFEFFTFEAPGNPLQQALDALQPKLEMPFLFDHNGMARQKIDPTTAMVKYPEARSYYKRILDQLLFQAKMTCELRVDEAGTPFLWLAPLKR